MNPNADHPMANRDTSLRTAAMVAATGYAALFVLAIFANFVVRTQLVDTDDAAQTISNITGNEVLFRLGALAFTVVFLIDVAVAWALYVLLRPHGQGRSMLAAWFRLAYTVFLGVAVIFMLLAVRLATGDASPTPLGGGSVESAVMVAMDGFNLTWLIGLAAFGVHLVLVGRVLLAADIAPRALGIALITAGVAYALDTAAFIMLPDYGRVESVMLAIVAIPSIVAELSFTVWLFVQARRHGRDDRHRRHPAAGRVEPAH